MIRTEGNTFNRSDYIEYDKKCKLLFAKHIVKNCSSHKPNTCSIFMNKEENDTVFAQECLNSNIKIVYQNELESQIWSDISYEDINSNKIIHIDVEYKSFKGWTDNGMPKNQQYIQISARKHKECGINPDWHVIIRHDYKKFLAINHNALIASKIAEIKTTRGLDRLYQVPFTIKQVKDINI